MAPAFEKRLVDLLPPVYLEKDATGDLQTFLRLPGEQLDRLKDLADRFPQIFDVDRCEPRFLPLLAHLAGWPFDPTKGTAPQRRAIREAVEFYRRKSTIPAMRRSLVDLGWDGWIEETFRGAFRLNRRGRLNTKRLPGEVYSYGVYRVHSNAPTAGVREALRVHHPAGTRAFFLTNLQMTGELESELEAFTKRIVWLLATARLREVFTLNRSRLNGPDPLTTGDENPAVMLATRSDFARQGFERAAVCLHRWHARGRGIRLNQSRLNAERFAYAWVSERVAAFCCKIEVDDPLPPIPVALRLNVDRLNRALVGGLRVPDCRVHFRKRDFFAEAEGEAPDAGGFQLDAMWQTWAKASSGFELSRTAIGEEPLAPLIVTNSELRTVAPDPPPEEPEPDPEPPQDPLPELPTKPPPGPVPIDPPDILRKPSV